MVVSVLDTLSHCNCDNCSW